MIAGSPNNQQDRFRPHDEISYCSIAENQIAEATIWTKGPILRAREASRDMRSSIDLLADKLNRQVKRYKGKCQSKRENRQQPFIEDGVVLDKELSSVDSKPAEEEPVIVKVKQFAVKPMTAEEALLQLELIGHDFFMFRNADSNEVNVLYRRRDAQEPVRGDRFELLRWAEQVLASHRSR